MQCIAHDKNGRCPYEALPNELFCEKHLKEDQQGLGGDVVLRDRLSLGEKFRVTSRESDDE